jgi:arylsulfatase A-like enzyme/cytochrome c-type biogenesis protein CcmH/NrfG
MSAAATRALTGWSSVLPLVALAWGLGGNTACGNRPAPAATPERARNVVLVTIDTLRADRLGVYGYTAARTPILDALARRGARFDRAYATAPITLTSHASLMSGRYPPGHGARHNGLRVSDDVPLLAEQFQRAGFRTGAFVGAFPLDRRFGLHRGFQTYGDRMPRVGGVVANERPGRAVVDEALAWLKGVGTAQFFVWVHLFEPHAPYGDPSDGRPTAARYDDEIAEADAQAGRLIAAAQALGDTLVVVASDHGEAFGEHGEIAHSLFVYDTTLRVPLMFSGTGVGVTVSETPVSLIDVAPTIVHLMGLSPFDSDGIDLTPSFQGRPGPPRRLYAESFAPLLDFGWSPLRAVREDGWKYIEAPRPELYQVSQDPSENHNMAPAEAVRVAAARERVNGYSGAALKPPAETDREVSARLQSLGYVGAGAAGRDATRADPKDRRELAAAIARITSGELHGQALERELRAVIAGDPDNPQMNMRLGFFLSEGGRCADAVPHFERAIAHGMPGADPHLGLARCHAQARRPDRASAELRAADRAEPGNPVVLANLGIVLSDSGHPADGIAPLERAVALDPDFHEARFNLAVAYARTGRRAESGREAGELLRRLPPGAPQRSEVERLLATVRP